MKRLGIIGGMGPMASAVFAEMITEMTDAANDQEHIEYIMHSCPWIPDRTEFLLGLSKDDPCVGIISVGKRLSEAGTDLIAIPCVTAHCFHKRISIGIPVPVVNVMSETADYLKKEGVERVGLLATDGVIKSGIFEKEIKSVGVDVILPSEEKQKYVMQMIYDDIKANNEINVSLYETVSTELFQNGCDVILLGCTELSMLTRENDLPGAYLDAMRVLAKVCVECCGKLNAKYNKLIYR